MKSQKVWLVTGASKGFGFEIAKAALEAGDKVAATIRKKEDSIAGKLNNNPNLLELLLDVTNESQVKAGVQKTVDHFGRLDVVVNNAGYGILTAIEEVSDQEARAQYDTNVFGVLNVVRAVLPYLRKQRSGHIINTSSLFAFDPIPGWALYASTKFAVEGISMGLAKELAPFNIKVTAIEPGLFTTDFLGKSSYKVSQNTIDDYKHTIVGQMRLGIDARHGTQPGDPSKLAEVVVRLSRSENPPLHLPVGSDAVSNYEAKSKQMAADIDTWRSVSLSTDHQRHLV